MREHPKKGLATRSFTSADDREVRRTARSLFSQELPDLGGCARFRSQHLAMASAQIVLPSRLEAAAPWPPIPPAI